jgi:hypothetical protein
VPGEVYKTPASKDFHGTYSILSRSLSYSTKISLARHKSCHYERNAEIPYHPNSKIKSGFFDIKTFIASKAGTSANMQAGIFRI